MTVQYTCNWKIGVSILQPNAKFLVLTCNYIYGGMSKREHISSFFRQFFLAKCNLQLSIPNCTSPKILDQQLIYSDLTYVFVNFLRHVEQTPFVLVSWNQILPSAFRSINPCEPDINLLPAKHKSHAAKIFNLIGQKVWEIILNIAWKTGRKFQVAVQLSGRKEKVLSNRII